MGVNDGIDIVTGGEAGEETEYFCTKCLQLRLSLISDKSHCGNCGSEHIITGKVDELNLADLLNKYAPKSK